MAYDATVTLRDLLNRRGDKISRKRLRRHFQREKDQARREADAAAKTSGIADSPRPLGA